MKIIMIRHEKVAMFWDRKYNSAGYDMACQKYDECPIIAADKKYFEADDTKKVYISELSRTCETAGRLFKRRDFLRTALLNEVPLRSFQDTDKMIPLWLWNLAGRIQWFLQSNRQPENREKTVIRAKSMIRMLEEQQEDCYLITHGFYMRVFIRELKKQGYRVKKDSILGIRNLGIIIAQKQPRRQH